MGALCGGVLGKKKRTRGGTKSRKEMARKSRGEIKRYWHSKTEKTKADKIGKYVREAFTTFFI